MPTYEYKCVKCGHIFELFQGIKEPHHNECPECKGPVKRLIGTGGGIIFKGSGFYATDYKNRAYKEKEKKEKESIQPKKNEKRETRDERRETINGFNSYPGRLL